MKYEDLRKKIFIETGILAVTALILSAGVYGLSSLDDDFTDENKNATQEADKIAAETTALDTKYRNIKNNSALYEEIQKKQAQGQLIITRQGITNILQHYQKDFFLASLKLTMPSINEAKEPEFKRKTSVVNVSEVTLDIDAISDEHIYRLIQSLQQDLPGVMSINKFTLSKQQSVSNDVLRNISEKGPIGIIKGSISFLWYGISPVETPATLTPGAK